MPTRNGLTRSLERPVSRLIARPARAAPGEPGRRPGKIRLALAGAGAFLLVMGLLLRFYAAPRLIAAPVNLDQTDKLVATGASYFDQSALTTRHGATLTYTVIIRGDPGASSRTIAVWDSSSVLADLTRGVQVNSIFQRAAFDRRTGQLVNCCGAALNDSTQVRQSGVGLFWPIGTQRRTYQVFDNNSGRAWPALYTGETRNEGVLTYRFTQHVPLTEVDQLAGIPTSLLGIPGPSRNVVAGRYYQADNIFWVDPRTGVLIDQHVRATSVLRGPGGQGRLVVADLNLKMTDASRRALAAEASKNAASITAQRVTGPLGGGVLGLLLILAATVPFRRRPARAANDSLENDGLEMVTDSMREVDTGPADDAVAPENKDVSLANGAVTRASGDGSKDTGRDARTDTGQDAGPAAATAIRESEDRPG